MRIRRGGGEEKKRTVGAARRCTFTHSSLSLSLGQKSSSMIRSSDAFLVAVITAAVAVAVAARLPTYDRQLFLRTKTASPDQNPMRTCADKSPKVEELARLAAAVCLNCHELNSHRNPNYNFECSADCYQNDTFRNCLNAFMGE
ncbi:hypothetical protein PRIPAC_96348, partial [Pristionchus pacificus]|uniref:Uncharacterized protein n=1 Tax=Pristionchus pacificus TaxID=54126 RepID=A0A8R1UML4_PRIPA